MLHLRIRLLREDSAVDFHGNALSIGDIRTRARVLHLVPAVKSTRRATEIDRGNLRGGI